LKEDKGTERRKECDKRKRVYVVGKKEGVWEGEKKV